MFCTSCGAPITNTQAVCLKCGATTSAGVMLATAPTRRVFHHYRTLGVLWIIYSALHALGGFGALFAAKFILSGVFSGMRGEVPNPPAFLIPLVTVVGWIILVKAAVGFAAGIGLLSKATWARMLMLIVGFVSLLDVPFGTAIGIYTIWVLLSSGAEEEYRQLTYAV